MGVQSNRSWTPLLYGPLATRRGALLEAGDSAIAHSNVEKKRPVHDVALFSIGTRVQIRQAKGLPDLTGSFGVVAGRKRGFNGRWLYEISIHTSPGKPFREVRGLQGVPESWLALSLMSPIQ